MTEKDSWKLIDELFNRALTLPVGKRKAFLRRECSDRDIREEVELLLESDQEAQGFIETTALEVEARKLADETHDNITTQKVGDYEFIESIGAGGMGTVHKAKHRPSGEIVAIKRLLPQFTKEPSVIRRFYREAKAIKALEHPNIARLIEISSDDDIHFIAMEYIEGQTVAKRILQGPLKTETVLRYAKQTAMALKAAHSKRILHRDIKPSNLLIQKNDVIKVLDFGLAKIFAESDQSSAAFSTDTLTKSGILVGTVNYMSPEQLAGKPIDQRNDIFSLGIVMYEMATGKQPFGGNSIAAKITAILDHPPAPLDQYRPNSPESLNQIVSKCLEKNPEDRYQSAEELIRDLQVSLGEEIDPLRDSWIRYFFDRLRKWW